MPVLALGTEPDLGPCLSETHSPTCFPEAELPLLSCLWAQSGQAHRFIPTHFLTVLFNFLLLEIYLSTMRLSFYFFLFFYAFFSSTTTTTTKQFFCMILEARGNIKAWTISSWLKVKIYFLKAILTFLRYALWLESGTILKRYYSLEFSC